MSPRQQPIKRRRVPATSRRTPAVPRGHPFLRQFFVGLAVLVFFALAIVVIWYGSRLEMFTITTVKVEGGETISHDQVRELAEDELKGEYHHLVPRRFTWTYPEEVILEKVKNIPRVKDVSVTQVDSNTILLKLTEYYPFALWCDENADMGGCLFLDAEGYAFMEAPLLTGSSMLRYKNNSSEPKRGEKPFDTTFMSDTSRFASSVTRDIGFSINQVERVNNDEVTYHIADGGQIKVSLRQSVDESLTNLVTVLGSDIFSHLRPGNFQYIDLRFGNKVFVNEEKDDLPATTTATSSPEEL